MWASKAAALADWYRVHRPAITRGFLVATATTIALLWWIEPITLSHRWVRTEALPTDNIYVARRIVTDPAAGAPDAIVIGASSMRDMIPPAASQRLSALCGRKISLLNAATSAQHPADSRAIVDSLRRQPAIIVVGLSYHRLTRSYWNDPWKLEQRHVALPRSARDFRAAFIRGELDADLFDSFAQSRRMSWEWTLLTSALRGTSYTPVPGARQDVDLIPDRPGDHRDKQVLIDTAWLTERGDFERSADEMARYWIDFAHEMKERGSRVIFVMTPYGREADAMQRAHSAAAHRALTVIGSQFPVIDQRGAIMDDRDFRDPLHVTHSGRDKLWRELSSALAKQSGCQPATAH